MAFDAVWLGKNGVYLTVSREDARKNDIGKKNDGGKGYRGGRAEWLGKKKARATN